MSQIPEVDEAELKVMTQNMFNNGGITNVLECISTMQKCQIIILKKLNEILENEKS